MYPPIQLLARSDPHTDVSHEMGHRLRESLILNPSDQKPCISNHAQIQDLLIQDLLLLLEHSDTNQANLNKYSAKTARWRWGIG